MCSTAAVQLVAPFLNSLEGVFITKIGLVGYSLECFYSISRIKEPVWCAASMREFDFPKCVLRGGSVRPNPEGRIIKNQKAKPEGRLDRKAENLTRIIPT